MSFLLHPWHLLLTILAGWINEQQQQVLAALERGEIHPRRHHSYARIYDTLPQ